VAHLFNTFTPLSISSKNRYKERDYALFLHVSPYYVLKRAKNE
jgi:hypothetical protein